ILLLAVAGIIVAARGRRAGALLGGLAAGALLVAAYAFRDPASERYLAQVLPFACVACGFAVAAVPRRLGFGIGAATLAATVLLAPAQARLAPDSFASVAAGAAIPGHSPLVTAAPDAYGFLLSGHA